MRTTRHSGGTRTRIGRMGGFLSTSTPAGSWTRSRPATRALLPGHRGRVPGLRRPRRYDWLTTGCAPFTGTAAIAGDRITMRWRAHRRLWGEVWPCTPRGAARRGAPPYRRDGVDLDRSRRCRLRPPRRGLRGSVCARGYRAAPATPSPGSQNVYFILNRTLGRSPPSTRCSRGRVHRAPWVLKCLWAV